MKGLLITLATESEKEWIALLLASNDPWLSIGITIDKCRASVQDPQHEIFVAHLHNEATGAMIIHPKGLAGAAYLKSIAVAADLRGKGIGTALLHFAEEHYRKISRHFFLCVSAFNKEAQEFYARNGYIQIATLKDHIIDGKDELLMSKRLP